MKEARELTAVIFDDDEGKQIMYKAMMELEGYKVGKPIVSLAAAIEYLDYLAEHPDKMPRVALIDAILDEEKAREQPGSEFDGVFIVRALKEIINPNYREESQGSQPDPEVLTIGISTQYKIPNADVPRVENPYDVVGIIAKAKNFPKAS